MIDLREQLSEFSYGYGVTREIETCFSGVGINTVPFLPNLVQEGKLGFDVGFDLNCPGRFVFLQFKLGQERQRYRRNNPGDDIPALARPFWSFRIDTTGGQFSRLLELQAKGMEVYYTAPRFSTWSQFGEIYSRGEIMENSLILKPSEIDTNISTQKVNSHRIVYDTKTQYVCSEPQELTGVYWPDVVAGIAERLLDPNAETLEMQFNRLKEVVRIQGLRMYVEGIVDPRIADVRPFESLVLWLHSLQLQGHLLCVTKATVPTDSEQV